MKKLYQDSCHFDYKSIKLQRVAGFLKLAVACFTILVFTTQVHAQLSAVNANAQTISQMLAGPGVTISNYVITGSPLQSGTFTYSGSNLQMAGGGFLTSGKVQDITAAATTTASRAYTTTGDAQLSTLTSGTIYDPIILEFDLVPQGPLLKFDYAFASEEYPELVCAATNDVFGIFITGPNPGGGNYTSQNLALVPNTSKPVGINSINPGSPGSGAGGGTCGGVNESLSYSSLYTNNLSPVDPDIVFDGMTKVLQASVAVTPCQTYHFKIAIADVGSRINDSGLFLSAYSFTTTPVSVSAVSQLDYAGFSSAYEGCVGGTFTLGLSQVQTVDVYINLSVTGSATNGTDYTAIPATVMIPAGQTSVNIDLDPLTDGVSESAETVTVAPLNPCSGVALSSATITIRDDIAAAITVADSTLCSSQSTQLTATGGLTYVWSPATGLSNANISNPVATPTSTTTYTTSMTWGACAKTATATVHISAPSLATSASPAGTVCNGGTVQITATPSSGVSPYSYLWSNGGTTPAITIATGGAYTVTSTDSYGCTANSSRAVTISNLSISGTATNVSCLGGNNGAIDITVTGSNAPFTYNWGGGVTSQDRTNLVTGTYTVTASNTVGCSVTASYTITQPAAALTTSATTSSVSCNGGNNGSINLTSNGGVSPYSYLWNTGATSQDMNSITAGTYLVTVTDFNGCTASRTSVITQPTAITTSETHVNESCFGQSVGSVNLSVSGGTGAYSYTWSNSAVTQDISSLAAGTYSVTVSDANSCTAARSVVISEPSSVSVALTSTNPSCFGGSNGSINTTATGGTSPYTYAWSNVATSQNITSLSASTFIVTVTDNNSCTGTASATLSEPAVLSASVTETNVSCSGGSNGTISLIVSGGTSPYTYNWGGGITTQNRTALAAGTYNVTATDNGGCTATASASITQPSALSVSNTSTNVSCNAGSNGSINITASGGTSPYSYNWGGGITTQDRSGLSSGTYNLTVTDAAACTASTSVIITQPTSLSFSETHVNATCNGGSNGSISVTIAGGTSPYTYNWGGGITTQNRTSVASGTYTLTSTDNNGCTVTGSATVSQPTAISISSSVTDASCAPGNNGAITLTISGGSSPYTYDWGGGITTQNRTSLFAGTYTVTVTDNIACSGTGAIAVSQIGTGMSLSASKTDVSCNGGNNGAIDMTLTGGSAPITYNWGGGITTEDRTSLTAGNYSLTVTDGLGCSAISSNIVTEPTAIAISANATNVLCNGASTGSITISVSGGASSYTYNWGGGVTTQNRTNIIAGTYVVTVTDANLCTATSTSTITQPLSAISLSTTISNVSCFGGIDGSVNLTASGGTGAYTFIWNNGNISQNQSSVLSGTYNVTVTDANACTATASSVVTQPATALSVSLAATDLSCNSVSTGTITTTVTGGTSTYTFNWDDAVGTQNRSALAAGNYSVTVTDNNSCSASAATAIAEPTALVISATATDITCNGLNNGAISLSVAGGISSYSYNWGGGVTTQSRTSLASGTYVVTVTDANLCTATSSTTIAEPTVLTLTINSGATICLSSTGTANAETNSSGTPPYTYLWSNGNNAQNLTSLAPGAVSVTVTDNNGCSISSSSTVALSGNNTDASFSVSGSYCGPANTLTFTHTGSGSIISHYWDFGNSAGSSTQNNPAYTYPGTGSFSVTHIVYRGYCSDTVTSPLTVYQKPILSSVNTNITCNGLNNGTIDLSVTGSPAFTYNWGGGITTQDRSGLAVGTYVVTVTDVNVCSSSLSVSVTEPSVLTVTNTNTNVSCNGGSNGAINLTVVGGTSGYSYNWGGGITTQNRTGLSGATYTVTVTDANSCSSVNAISVYQPNALSLVTAVTNVACNGQNNGAINLTVTGGTGTYSYNWGGGITTQNRTSLNAGTFNITVTDANSCSASTSAVVTQPSALTTALSSSSVSCYGGNNGNITSSISGGTPPFNYTWNDGNTNGNRSNLSSGSYSVTILDQNSCSVSSSASVTQPSTAVSVVVNSVSTISCYGDSTGTINITASGGVPGYTYLWSDSRIIEDRTNMLGGTYFVSATDVNGCSIATSATINQPSAPLAIDTIVAVNVLCYGAATGSLTPTVSGGTTPYSYSWNGGVTSANRTNILAGTYTLTVTDFKGCTATATTTITQPAVALSATASVTNVACFGNSTGAINVTVTGGTGAYTYNWGGGITTQNRTNIIAGTYNVTVTDANACSVSLSRTVTQPAAALSASTSVTNVTCFGNSTGAVILTVTGGTTTYSYNWGGGITTQNRTSVPAGTYNVTVTDANACSTSTSATITQPAAALSVSASAINVACFGNSTGAVTLTVAGGTTAYTYNWGGGITTQNRTSIVAGTYNVTVTDANACSTSTSATVTQPAAALSASATVTNVACFGNSTGAINVAVTGGTGAYAYNWGGGITTQNRTSIPSGTYNLTVTDANACSVSLSRTVTQPAAALSASTSVTNVACFGNSTGAVTLTVAGGTATYTYNWGGGITTQNRTSVPAGTYNVTVTDANACSTSASATITQPSAALNALTSVTNVACFGNSTGAVTLTVTGGTTTYTYNWGGGIITQNRTSIPAGTYNVTVTDANACSTSTSATVTQPAAVLSATASVTNVACNGNSTGAITLTITGGTTGYTYNWGGGITTQNRTNIAGGTYNVTVTDANACSTFLSRTVTQPAAALSASTSVTNVACFGNSTGAVTLTVTGGTTTYSYNWGGGVTTQTRVNIPSGTYNVTVTDANACSTSASATITQPAAALSISASATNVACFGNSTGAVTLTVAGGTTTYTYNWGGGITTQNRTSIPAGTYNVTVTDANACSTSASATVTQPAAALSATASVTNVACFGNSTGAITLTVTGGTGVYSYNWGGGITTQNRTNIIAGTYNVTVTDANACSTSLSGTVTQPSAALNASASVTDVACFGNLTGAINLIATGGITPYLYNWGGGITTQNRTNIGAGMYNVTVTDANSCSTSVGKTVAQPGAPLNVSTSITVVSCYGNSTGAINLSVNGGTTPYSYNWNDGVTTQNRTNILAGIYSLTVTDANICSVSTSAVVTQPIAALSVSSTATNIACYGNATGTINLTVSGGTGIYFYNWNDGVATQDRTSLSAGTYNVTITDLIGCSTSTSIIITQPSAPLSTAVSITNVACFGNTTGAITLTVTGGTTTYSYNWGGGITAQNRTTIPAGTYNVTVTDANACSTSASATITQPSSALSVSASTTNVACFGNSTGAVTLIVAGGTTTYTYNWGGGVMTQNRTSIAAGTYNVTVTDANACSTSTSSTVTQPAAALSATASVTNVACFGNSTGAVNVTVTGGTGVYSYNWGGGITTQNRTNIIAGTYNVTVTDANACSTSLSRTVTQPAGTLSASTSVTNVACFGNSTGAVTLTVAGGTTTYTYNWGGGIITQNRTSVPAGSYSVTVTDANACSTSTSATVTQPVAALSVTTSITNVACNGNSTGAVTLTVAGGTTAYTYNWGSGITTQDRVNIPSGIYNVTVTDANACSTSTSATVTQPAAALSASATVTNVACFGNSTGAITLTVIGGTTGYTYNWGGGITTQNRTNINSGTYNVTVTDANACSTSISRTVTQPVAALSASTFVTNVACSGNSTGGVTLTVTGGTIGYSYDWGGGITTQNRTSVPVGTYSVTVTDANACSTSTSANVTEPSLFSISTTSNNATCNGAWDGNIDLTVSGATPAYTFLWSNGANTEDLNNIPAGNYSVTVQDANSCVTTTNVTITQPISMSVSEMHTGVSCNAGSNGSINITINGGTVPYAFMWNDGVTTQNRTNLPAGTYQLLVNDLNSCAVSQPIVITEPAVISIALAVVNVSCNGANNGSITASITGGTPNYALLWSIGGFSPSLTNLSPGNYSVSVTDMNSCTATQSAVVTEPAPLNATASKTDVACYGASTGSIDVTVNGGTAAYGYNWNNGGTTEDKQNLAAGTYVVTITDVNACSISISTTIAQPAAVLNATASVTNVACFGNTTGAINLAVTGGTGAYSYNWGGGITTQNRTNIAAGSYNVIVTDANACSTSTSATVTQPAGVLSASTSVTNVACFGNSTGAVTLTVTGGTTSYTYDWGGGITTQNRTALPAGSYSVIVTDANACSTSASATVTQPAAALNATAAATNVACSGNSTGAISLTVTGGTTSYAYNWGSGITTQNRTNIPAGTYSVTVTDANSCSASTSATVTQPVAVLLTLSKTDPLCNGDANGTIDLTVSGGVAPMSYLWNTGVTMEDPQNFTGGAYSVLVTDNNGCTSSGAISLVAPSAIVLTESHTNESCNGSSNAKINLNVTGGTPSYQFVWSNGSTTQNIANIPVGSYNVRVTDTKGCSATLSGILITEPAALDVSVNVIDVACVGELRGKINTTVTGGTAPYIYLWNTQTNTMNLTNVAAGTYQLTATDANNCSISIDATINTLPQLEVEAVADELPCENAKGGIDLTVKQGSGPFTFRWNNGVTDEDLKDVRSGSYYVTVSDVNGCRLDTVFTVMNLNTFSVNAGESLTIKLGETIELSATTTGSSQTTFSWAPVFGMDCSTCPEVTVQPRQSTVYTLVGTDVNGCVAEDTVSVEVIEDHGLFIPNVFTPNGDGKNDLFQIYGNTAGIHTFNIMVFNRYGEKVFESGEANFTWDGTYKGEPLPPSMCIYVIKAVFLDTYSDKSLKGNLTILR